MCNFVTKSLFHINSTTQLFISCSVSALQYLGMNLRCKLLADAAASSMCYICCTAKTKLKSEFAPLLDILKNLNSFDVSNKSVIFIINGN